MLHQTMLEIKHILNPLKHNNLSRLCVNCVYRGSRVRHWHSTLALVIDLFGGDNFVDDCLEEVVLPRHPGWKTGDVQLLVANGVIQR